MADDWIKFRTQLWDDPRVRLLSRKCPAPRGQVVGALVRLWSLADKFAVEENGAGVLRGYTPEDINREVDIPNFVQNLPSDWCEIKGDALYLPQYQEHNGVTAKSRAADAKRKRMSRKRPKNVRTQPDKCPGNVRARPDQRREEKSIYPPTPLKGERSDSKKPKPDDWSEARKHLGQPSELDCLEFEAAWVRWATHRSEKKARLTPSTVSRQIRKLDGLGLSRAVAAIDHSIEHGWTGLFESDAKTQAPLDAGMAAWAESKRRAK